MCNLCIFTFDCIVRMSDLLRINQASPCRLPRSCYYFGGHSHFNFGHPLILIIIHIMTEGRLTRRLISFLVGRSMLMLNVGGHYNASNCDFWRMFLVPISKMEMTTTKTMMMMMMAMIMMGFLIKMVIMIVTTKMKLMVNVKFTVTILIIRTMVMAMMMMQRSTWGRSDRILFFVVGRAHGLDEKAKPSPKLWVMAFTKKLISIWGKQNLVKLI